MSDVYHAGEISVQKLAGAEIVARQNGRTVRRGVPKGAIPFLSTQAMVIAASVDGNGRVWSSLLIGEPGFIAVEDEFTLTIKSTFVESDPLIKNLQTSPEIGLLAIDFNRRIRIRINGRGAFNTDGAFVVSTEQVYGNCPKYIQKRSMLPQRPFVRVQKSKQYSSSLNTEQKIWIGESDTFFIGSISSEGKLDASHRGGSPGFVKIADEKTIYFPDYFGNSMFNTLGNIYSNPSTGILFIDFNYGHSLQLTGLSEIIWDETQISLFPGAERIVRFEIDKVLYTENSTPIGWEFIEYSPVNPKL